MPREKRQIIEIACVGSDENCCNNKQIKNERSKRVSCHPIIGKTVFCIYICEVNSLKNENFYFFSYILIACGGQTPSQARQKIQSGSLSINGFFSDAGLPGESNQW